MRSTEWILYVEDDRDLRDTVTEELADHGYQVVAVADGYAALAEATRRHPPAAVITDLMMPGMNGWELVATLRSNPTLSAVPVVVLSAAHARAPLDVDAVVGKPVTIGALIMTLQSVQARPAADRDLPTVRPPARSSTELMPNDDDTRPLTADVDHDAA